MVVAWVQHKKKKDIASPPADVSSMFALENTHKYHPCIYVIHQITPCVCVLMFMCACRSPKFEKKNVHTMLTKLVSKRDGMTAHKHTIHNTDTHTLTVLTKTMVLTVSIYV